MNYTVYEAKGEGPDQLCVYPVQLVCAFVLIYAKAGFLMTAHTYYEQCDWLKERKTCMSHKCHVLDS